MLVSDVMQQSVAVCPTYRGTGGQLQHQDLADVGAVDVRALLHPPRRGGLHVGVNGQHHTQRARDTVQWQQLRGADMGGDANGKRPLAGA